MTRNWKMSNNWAAGKMSKDDQREKKRDVKKKNSSRQPNRDTDIPSPNSHAATLESIDLELTDPSPDSEPPKTRRGLRIPRNWQFWAGVIVFLFGTTGFMATAALLKLPAVPNCPKIFLPTASASMRMYCAQNAASKGTLDNLFEAIALVEELPADHPLRPQVEESIQEWSVEIMRLAEEDFQGGDLEGAISTVQKIPRNVEAYQLVEEKIARWRSIWKDAEAIDADVERLLRASEWAKAFRAAAQLLNVDNEFWATLKFEQISQKIQLAREESRKLDSAYASLNRGGVENWLQAIKQAQTISNKSYAYAEAQKLIKKAGDKLLEVAKTRLQQGDWQGVLQVTREIPASLDLHAEVQEMTYLASAGTSAKIGTIAGLENAIQDAQRISSNSSLHNKAQTLIATWQLEIEDLAHLMKARQYAGAGNINNLSAAIAEADLIPARNPRYSEAQREIDKWQTQIEIKQDRPILDRAIQLASYGTVVAYQEGIQEASRIPPNRALSGEAQEKIRQWRRQIEIQQDKPILNRAEQLANLGTPAGLQAGIQQARQIASNRALSGEAQQKVRQWTRQNQVIQDQPILDQAIALAKVGDYTNAINTARQIASGRALSSEAQSKIQTWQGEIQANQNLQQANQIAIAQTPSALAQAIQIARRVPNSSQASRQSRQEINRWSFQLLSIAEAQANMDLAEAIRIAETVPSGTAAYDSARSKISMWRQMLQPAPPTIQPEFVPEPLPLPEVRMEY